MLYNWAQYMDPTLKKDFSEKYGVEVTEVDTTVGDLWINNVHGGYQVNAELDVMLGIIYALLALAVTGINLFVRFGGSDGWLSTTALAWIGVGIAALAAICTGPQRGDVVESGSATAGQPRDDGHG